ncbi:MAG: response regulator transcription factor [Clostridia bacterium]|nr:response regulator transcription factor [Clostridia bacterium]
MSNKILIVEDEANIVVLISLYLNKEGFEICTASDGIEALEKFKTFSPDLVLLDLMLPKLDGWGVCREIRKESQTPIIMLTAKDETLDKVTGLEIGADDYISKPFEMKEVIARIHAVLRRSSRVNSRKNQVLTFDNLIIDTGEYRVTVAGKRITLPKMEFELLYFLASNPGRIYTRDELLDHVWGFDYTGDTTRTVDVHIKRLRDKIQHASKYWRIKTLPRRGYGFEVGEEE